MKNILALNKIFVGQQSPDDCGIACLAMILNYEGRYNDSDKFFFSTSAPSGGVSLLELRNLSSFNGLSARCVSMDLPALRKLAVPCILHVRNQSQEDHYIVCLGCTKRKDTYYYIIGDPATRIHMIAEHDLQDIWTSHAALYFENLRYCRPRFREQAWLRLLQIKALRNTLFICVPLLNIGATILGIALSWLLQRGINDSFADKKDSLVTAIITLLFIMMIFRSLVNYLRQRILIKLNKEVRERLTTSYLCGLFRQESKYGNDEHTVKKGLNDIQRIQNSVAALISVLFSDGFIITLIVSGLCYFEPIVGLINIICAALAIIIGLYFSDDLSFREAEINEIAAGAERSLLSAFVYSLPPNNTLDTELSSQMKVLNRSGLLAISISRYNLFYECIGAVNVIAVLIFCIYLIRQQQISYNMLMTDVILSYFVTVLLPKVCNVFPVITAGATLIKRFK